MCARRRSNFLLPRQEKVTKEKAPLLCVSLRCAAGNLRCSGRGCAAELTARYALRSNNCGESVLEVRASFGTRTHPLPCASRHAQKGTQGADIHTGHRCARPVQGARVQSPRAAQTKPSAAMASKAVGCWLLAVGCWLSSIPTHLAAPAWRRFRGGMRVGARMLRQLTRRGCSSAAPKARSEFHGAPRNRHGAGLPRSNAKGSLPVGRLSFGYFSLAKQRTSASPAGATPGLRTPTKHAAKTSAQARASTS